MAAKAASQKHLSLVSLTGLLSADTSDEAVSFALGACHFPADSDAHADESGLGFQENGSALKEDNVGQFHAASFILEAYYGVAGTSNMVDVTAKVV